MQRLRRLISLMLVLSVCLSLAGCGQAGDSRLPTTKVDGHVLFQGQPVPSGTITFFPVDGGKHATGLLREGGTFALSTYEPRDGAIIGQHKVVIQVAKIGPDGVAILGADRIPTNYSARETTPLTVEVKQDTESLTIELKE